MFKVTDESTGQELQVFAAADFPKGQNGALYAAARYAAAQQREGATVLLQGPEGFAARRYAPEYLKAASGGRWPYRVPCAVAGCSNWVHPRNPRQAPVCREHFAATPGLVDQAARMRGARKRRQP